jgi:hypothetical protein
MDLRVIGYKDVSWNHIAQNMDQLVTSNMVELVSADLHSGGVKSLPR